ncbi:TIGR03750 family conjugal transfer protein [Pseudomonas sp. GD03858]|uniref:TIGR03750 family conjugal transfer protein n=1 Tax=unclassified Pseudomonas TaxID=196821 RepID=UPI00244A4A8B|nr:MULTISPECIES: TIGR03750 family conjugal transfer protein [unclassified Pseudomonas]MDH0645235.1 TIGR03750 family conjugal transfer protein [Pseudomonas sp. GD03867]MDH0660857.1 TIGR03750 family conjugal transfer protein [Pseudomonas sp. GD03858]
MSDAPATLPDGTLTFLPERLNRDPAVLRGLTNDEMWVALIVGAVLGVVLGAPLAVATASIATLPTCMFLCMALVLLGGGKLLRRAKRARPETWLYRRLQWQLAAQWGIGTQTLILHSGPWTVRRTRRPARTSP